MSGQDELNPVLCLATQVGEMALSCLLRIIRYVPQENSVLFPYNKSFIYQACSIKMDIGLVHFLRVYDPDSVLVHKHAKKEPGQYPAILALL